MAGEYGVNIKFRAIGLSQIDKATAKAKELENSVSKIRSLDLGKAIGGPVGDRVAEATGQIKRYAQQINKTGKVIGKTQLQQEAALEAFENLRKQVKIGGKDYNILTEAINKQNTAIAKQNELNTKSIQIRRKQAMFPGMKQGFLGNLLQGQGGALQSGLVSGAFPLLFGQGPLGGAAGFAGGFLGTKMGGQMGGFAGGLVATAALQQITTAVDGITQLGKALDPENLDLSTLSKSLGLLGTDTEKYLQLVEKTQGKQAAYNLAIAETTKLIGQDGVEALQAFAESSQNLTNEMSKFFTRLGAGIAGLFNKVGKGKGDRVIGFERSNILAEAKLVTDNKEIMELVEKVKTARGKNRDILNDQIISLMEIKKQEEAIAMKTKIRKLENEDLKKSIEDTKLLYDSIANSIETGIVDAIDGAIKGTKTLGDVARSVFGEIQRQLISFGVSSFLGGIFPGFFGRAEGGPVKAGGSYIVGERGPEMFSPGVSGTITPNHAMGSTTSVVVNVDASGSSVEGDEAQGRELGRLISVAVQSEIVQQQRPGGLLA